MDNFEKVSYFITHQERANEKLVNFTTHPQEWLKLDQHQLLARIWDNWKYQTERIERIV